MSNNDMDNKIYNYISNKILTTTGEEQKQWVKKFDIFTCRSLFSKKNMVDELEQVEEIKRELLKYVQ